MATLQPLHNCQGRQVWFPVVSSGGGGGPRGDDDGDGDVGLPEAGLPFRRDWWGHAPPETAVPRHHRPPQNWIHAALGFTILAMGWLPGSSLFPRHPQRHPQRPNDDLWKRKQAHITPRFSRQNKTKTSCNPQPCALCCVGRRHAASLLRRRRQHQQRAPPQRRRKRLKSRWVQRQPQPCAPTNTHAARWAPSARDSPVFLAVRLPSSLSLPSPKTDSCIHAAYQQPVKYNLAVAREVLRHV
jgi:hypothetical protein